MKKLFGEVASAAVSAEFSDRQRLAFSAPLVCLCAAAFGQETRAAVSPTKARGSARGLIGPQQLFPASGIHGEMTC